MLVCLQMKIDGFSFNEDTRTDRNINTTYHLKNLNPTRSAGAYVDLG